MEKQIIMNVDNLKCGGCENTITKILNSFDEVSKINIDAINGVIEVTHHGPQGLAERIGESLSKAGYPPLGSTNLIQKAKSYVSCVKGRMS